MKRTSASSVFLTRNGFGIRRGVTLGWEQIVMATGRRETWRNPSLKGPSERPDPNGLPVCQTQAKAGKQV
jgi:hypothetical protein